MYEKRFILKFLINRNHFEVFKILRTDATTCFGSMCNSWSPAAGEQKNRHAFETKIVSRQGTF